MPTNAERPTPEVLDQAIAVLATAVEWSTLPRSDSVSPARQTQNSQWALSVVVTEARRAQSMVDPVQPTEAFDGPVLTDVSANGTTEEE